MRTVRSAVLVVLACCVAATGALARPTSQSKGARSEKTTKKHRATSAKSKKSKARKQETRARRTSGPGRFTAHYPDLPPEDLPEEEIESDANELR